jgi:hypothetical protein
LKNSVFWDITPCSPFKVNRRFGGTAEQADLPPAFPLVSCLAYYSTLKMEATCSPETSVDLQRTTRHYISQDETPYNHRCENLKSYNVFLICGGFFKLQVTERNTHNIAIYSTAVPKIFIPTRSIISVHLKNVKAPLLCNGCSAVRNSALVLLCVTSILSHSFSLPRSFRYIYYSTHL